MADDLRQKATKAGGHRETGHSVKLRVRHGRKHGDGALGQVLGNCRKMVIFVNLT